MKPFALFLCFLLLAPLRAEEPSEELVSAIRQSRVGGKALDPVIRLLEQKFVAPPSRAWNQATWEEVCALLNDRREDPKMQQVRVALVTAMQFQNDWPAEAKKAAVALMALAGAGEDLRLLQSLLRGIARQEEMPVEFWSVASQMFLSPDLSISQVVREHLLDLKRWPIVFWNYLDPLFSQELLKDTALSHFIAFKLIGIEWPADRWEKIFNFVWRERKQERALIDKYMTSPSRFPRVEEKILTVTAQHFESSGYQELQSRLAPSNVWGERACDLLQAMMRSTAVNRGAALHYLTQMPKWNPGLESEVLMEMFSDDGSRRSQAIRSLRRQPTLSRRFWSALKTRMQSKEGVHSVLELLARMDAQWANDGWEIVRSALESPNGADPYRLVGVILSRNQDWPDFVWPRMSKILEGISISNEDELLLNVLKAKKDWPELFRRELPSLLNSPNAAVRNGAYKLLHSRPTLNEREEEVIVAWLHGDSLYNIERAQTVLSGRKTWSSVIWNALIGAYRVADPNMKKILVVLAATDEVVWPESYWNLVADELRGHKPQTEDLVELIMRQIPSHGKVPAAVEALLFELVEPPSTELSRVALDTLSTCFPESNRLHELLISRLRSDRINERNETAIRMPHRAWTEEMFRAVEENGRKEGSHAMFLALKAIKSWDERVWRAWIRIAEATDESPLRWVMALPNDQHWPPFVWEFLMNKANLGRNEVPSKPIVRTLLANESPWPAQLWESVPALLTTELAEDVLKCLPAQKDWPLAVEQKLIELLDAKVGSVEILTCIDSRSTWSLPLYYAMRAAAHRWEGQSESLDAHVKIIMDKKRELVNR